MSKFDNMKATTVADLYERGFSLVDSEHIISGSMLPVKQYMDIRECFVWKTGSIANFREVFITWMAWDSEDEEYILSVTIHEFSESGEWCGDHESLIYKEVPESRIQDFLRRYYIYTKAEREAEMKERRARLAEAKAKRAK